MFGRATILLVKQCWGNPQVSGRARRCLRRLPVTVMIIKVTDLNKRRCQLTDTGEAAFTKAAVIGFDARMRRRMSYQTFSVGKCFIALL